MAEKWTKSESIAQLVTALAQAQLKFDPVLKDSDNPAYRSKYADLQSVISATLPHLASVGLSVIQMPHAEFGVDDAKILTLTTLLAHKSGEWISSDLSLPAMMRERFDAQSVGSAVTYARRYALQAMLGVAAEVDDDGNAAAGVGSKAAAQHVGPEKIRQKAPNGSLEVSIVEYKEGQYALTGENGLAILKAEMNDGEKAQVGIKYDREGKVFVIRQSDGHLFASLAERYDVPVKWV